jgi:hypothetical protein
MDFIVDKFDFVIGSVSKEGVDSISSWIEEPALCAKVTEELGFP